MVHTECAQDVQRIRRPNGSNVIPRRARPGLAGLGPHNAGRLHGAELLLDALQRGGLSPLAGQRPLPHSVCRKRALPCGRPMPRGKDSLGLLDRSRETLVSRDHCSLASDHCRPRWRQWPLHFPVGSGHVARPQWLARGRDRLDARGVPPATRSELFTPFRTGRFPPNTKISEFTIQGKSPFSRASK